MFILIIEVRQGLYTKSIGVWRKYATQLKPFIDAMKVYIKKLKTDGIKLPYKNDINWDLDPNWPKYETLGELPAPEGDKYRNRPIVGKPVKSKAQIALEEKQKQKSKSS